MKTVLVFLNGELVRQISYRTKKIARGNYNHFKANGILDPSSGTIIKNAHFELI